MLEESIEKIAEGYVFFYKRLGRGAFELPFSEKPKKNKKTTFTCRNPKSFPRKTKIFEPESIPADARKIGERIMEILEYIPAIVYVLKFIRPKYIVKSNDEETKIAIAPLPSLPISKGNIGHHTRLPGQPFVLTDSQPKIIEIDVVPRTDTLNKIFTQLNKTFKRLNNMDFIFGITI